MKQIVSLIALVFAMSLMTFSQLACQPAPDANRSESTAAPNTNSGRVDTAAIEAELLRIENDWPRVIKEKDVAAMRRVEADDAVFIYPDGSTGGKDKDIKDIESGAFSAESVEILDLDVKVLNNDAAIVIGHNRLNGGKYKMPDGKVMDISGEFRFIDTFARRNGEWKLIAGAAAKVMEPAASASPAASATPAMKASPRATSTPAAKAPAATTPPVTKATP